MAHNLFCFLISSFVNSFQCHNTPQDTTHLSKTLPFTNPKPLPIVGQTKFPRLSTECPKLSTTQILPFANQSVNTSFSPFFPNYKVKNLYTYSLLPKHLSNLYCNSVHSDRFLFPTMSSYQQRHPIQHPITSSPLKTMSERFMQSIYLKPCPQGPTKPSSPTSKRSS